MISGRYPNRGPQLLVDAGIPMVDSSSAPAAATRCRSINDGAGSACSAAPCCVGDEVVAEGARLDRRRRGRPSWPRPAPAWPPSCRRLTHNSAEFLRREQDLLLHGHGLPRLRTAIAGRPVVVVGQGPDDAAELRAHRAATCASSSPVADRRRPAAPTRCARPGSRPTSWSLDRGPRSCPPARGAARGPRRRGDRADRGVRPVAARTERLERLGVRPLRHARPRAAPADAALLLADARRRAPDRRRRAARHARGVPRRQPRRARQHLPDPAQGRSPARRRRGGARCCTPASCAPAHAYLVLLIGAGRGRRGHRDDPGRPAVGARPARPALDRPGRPTSAGGSRDPLACATSSRSSPSSWPWPPASPSGGGPLTDAGVQRRRRLRRRAAPTAAAGGAYADAFAAAVAGRAVRRRRCRPPGRAGDAARAPTPATVAALTAQVKRRRAAPSPRTYALGAAAGRRRAEEPRRHPRHASWAPQLARQIDPDATTYDRIGQLLAHRRRQPRQRRRPARTTTSPRSARAWSRRRPARPSRRRPGDAAAGPGGDSGNDVDQPIADGLVAGLAAVRQGRRRGRRRPATPDLAGLRADGVDPATVATVDGIETQRRPGDRRPRPRSAPGHAGRVVRCVGFRRTRSPSGRMEPREAGARTKHVFVTGGVASSLGKGLTASSLGPAAQLARSPRDDAEAGPLPQRRSRDDEPVPARRGLRHQRRRRDRPRHRPLRAVPRHRPRARSPTSRPGRSTPA